MHWQKKIKPNGMRPDLFDKITGEIYKKKFDKSAAAKIPGCIWTYHY